jgi:carbamoyltransferase
MVRLQRDGTFELDLDWFVHHAAGATMTWDDGEPSLGTLYSQRLVEAFGPPRPATYAPPPADGRPAPDVGIGEHYNNVAASLQVMLEEAEFHLVRTLQQTTGQTALCLAGGVALNSVFNGKILPQTDFKDVFVQPAAGDAGTALGVAYYIYHQLLGQPRRFTMDHAYTGPAFDNDRLAGVLERYGLDGERLEEDELCAATARLVADGQVVGWFQGRMEWGPRALGNRSIIADPRRGDMKDILNARIKHREAFRPFAPSVLLESTGGYFDQEYPDPFMLKVYGVRADRREAIPAVTHIDGTGRLQTVDRASAPRYWRLIKSFEELTGVPIVLNTSFNENEPIVCRPEEAVECFLRTRMDALALGDYLIRKG